MLNNKPPIQRIVVLGTSGSGKTTLGKKISQLSGYPFTDLDDLFWLPGWTPRPEEEFSNLIQDIADKERWIISGNYSRMAHLTWPRADALIWLDFPMRTLLWRSFKRSLRRIIKKEPCCNGNYETFGRLLSRNSILWWIVTTYHRRKKALKRLLNEPKGKKLNLIRISNHSEYEILMRNIRINLEEHREEKYERSLSQAMS